MRERQEAELGENSKSMSENSVSTHQQAHTHHKKVVKLFYMMFLYNSCISDLYIYWFEYQNFQFWTFL